MEGNSLWIHESVGRAWIKADLSCSYSFPFALNHSMARPMLSRMGVWGIPNSLTAFELSQKEYSLPTRTQAEVVTGGFLVTAASNS